MGRALEGSHLPIGGGHTLLMPQGSQGQLRRVHSEQPKKKRPASAGSQVSRHKASDDDVLGAHDIRGITARWAGGPWAETWKVLEERKTVIVRPQQPAGEDGIVRIPHVVGSKLENHRRDDEWVLVVETCHQCECHRQEWLHHDAQDYRSALEVVRSASNSLESSAPIQCIQLPTPDLNQRVGAFEVFLLPPRICEPAYFAYLIHSKLLTRKWPSHRSLVHRLRDDMPRLDHRGWKLALNGLKSNLDIFSLWKQAEQQAKHLEEEMCELASHAEKRVADLEERLNELPELQYQLEQLSGQKRELLEKWQSCQQEVHAAELREQQLQLEVQKLKDLKQVSEGELKARLQVVEDELKDRNSSIKDLTVRQEQTLENWRLFAVQNQDLQKELETARVDLAQQQGQLAQSQCQVRSLEDERKALAAERDLLRRESSLQSKELDECKRSNAELQRQLHLLQRDLDIKEQKACHVGELEDNMRQLEDQKRELTESLHLCERQKLVAETEQKCLNQSILSASSREKELQRELWQLEGMKAGSEKELTGKLAELEDQLNQRDATIRELAASQGRMLDAQQMAGSTSQALQREVELLRTERSECQSTIRRLEDETKLLGSRLGSQQEDSRKEVRALREELDALGRSNAELKKQLEESLRQQRQLVAAQHQADRSAGQAALEAPAPPKTFSDMADMADADEGEGSEPDADELPPVPPRVTITAPPESISPTQAVKPPSEPPAPAAPQGSPVMLEPPKGRATVEAVTRAEVVEDAYSTDTEISVGDSDEDSVMMH